MVFGVLRRGLLRLHSDGYQDFSEESLQTGCKFSEILLISDDRVRVFGCLLGDILHEDVSSNLQEEDGKDYRIPSICFLSKSRRESGSQISQLFPHHPNFPSLCKFPKR